MRVMRLRTCGRLLKAPIRKCETQWQEPEALLATAFSGGNTYQPHVFSDGRGSVWVVAKTRKVGAADGQGGRNPRGYWEYALTRFEGKGWSNATILPNSKGRSSTRVNAALTSNGGLAIIW